MSSSLVEPMSSSLVEPTSSSLVEPVSFSPVEPMSSSLVEPTIIYFHWTSLLNTITSFRVGMTMYGNNKVRVK